jgi:hypothetical protein
MNTFQVWLSPWGATCKVRVDGISNANWLLSRLHQDFVFYSSEPVSDGEGSTRCTFHMTYSTQSCYRTFERLLAAIPEVQWTLDPVRVEEAKKGVSPLRKAKSRSLFKVGRAFKASPSTTITAVPKSLFSMLSRVVAFIKPSGS